MSAAELRLTAISEFAEWLRSRTSKHDRPFQEDTITACDTVTLNRFFTAYLAGHSQTGTNAVQRNLAHLFTWLEATYQHPRPRHSGPAAVRPAENAAVHAALRSGPVRIAHDPDSSARRQGILGSLTAQPGSGLGRVPGQ